MFYNHTQHSTMYSLLRMKAVKST